MLIKTQEKIKSEQISEYIKKINNAIGSDVWLEEDKDQARLFKYGFIVDKFNIYRYDTVKWLWINWSRPVLIAKLKFTIDFTKITRNCINDLEYAVKPVFYCEHAGHANFIESRLPEYEIHYESRLQEYEINYE